MSNVYPFHACDRSCLVPRRSEVDCSQQIYFFFWLLSRIEPAFGGTHPFPYAHTAWRPRARPNPVPRPPCPSKLESGPRVIRSCCPSTKLINPIRTSTSRRVPTRGPPTSDIQYSVVLSYPRRRTKSPRPPRSSVDVQHADRSWTVVFAFFFF